MPEHCEILGWSPSTIKNRLAAGVFGDPATLKPDPPKWHVPPERLRGLLGRFEQGYQIGPEGLQEPADDRDRETAPGADQGSRANEDAVAASGSTPSPRPPRRRSEGRHNGWRQYVDESPQRPPS